MIEQQARVSQLADGKATVILAPVSGCPACDAGQGCGAGIFGRLLKRKPFSLEMKAVDGLVLGQPVMLGIPESLFLRLLARLYLLPLLACLAGAAAGHFLAGLLSLQGALQDALALGGALIFFLSTLTFSRAGPDSASASPRVRLLPGSGAVAHPVTGQHCRNPAN